MSSRPKLTAAEPVFEPGRPDGERWWPWLVLCGALGAIFFAQLHHFAPFFGDDGFISLRYSDRLLLGKGLTWNDMRPVEGYSNLLWVLLCAALGRIGFPLPFASLMLGITCAALSIAAVVAQAYRDYPVKIRLLAAVLAGGALSLSGPFAVWAKSGLEQPLLAALLGWACYFGMQWVATETPSARDTTVIAILLGLVCITRADGAVFTAAFFLAGIAADGVSLRSALSRSRVLPIPVLFVAAQVIFRRAYYGEWVPNTAYVKIAFTAGRVLRGIKYDLKGFGIEAPFFVLAAIGLAALWKNGRGRQARFLLVAASVWLVYLTLIGGDIFLYSRHFIPLLAILAFAIAGCGLLALRDATVSLRRAAALCTLAALVLTSDHYGTLNALVAQGTSVAQFLNQAFADRQPLLCSNAAGVVPFYTRFPAIDPLGLNDYHIARHRPPNFGQGPLAHELADGKYVLDLRPDIIILSGYYSAILLESDRQIVNDPRFADHYQPVRFDTEGPHALRAVMYVRRIDGKVGIRESAQRVDMPGYLATMDEANAVKLIDGRAMLVLPPGGSAEFKNIPVTPGSWILHVQSKGASMLALSGADGTLSADKPVELPAKFSFAVRNRGTSPVAIESIDLVR